MIAPTIVLTKRLSKRKRVDKRKILKNQEISTYPFPTKSKIEQEFHLQTNMFFKRNKVEPVPNGDYVNNNQVGEVIDTELKQLQKNEKRKAAIESVARKGGKVIGAYTEATSYVAGKGEIAMLAGVNAAESIFNNLDPATKQKIAVAAAGGKQKGKKGLSLVAGAGEQAYEGMKEGIHIHI